ncbi:MAG: hypothetical protein HY465_05360 [Deltaproteobacteria bacterium]|nr:hypothetical protein [Deltaproteobacteria bacterium]
MMPNRLQANWTTMKPKMLTRWSHLTDDDLETTNGEFDGVVELIRKRYKPDRSHITVEAKIRDWINHELSELERGAA